VFFACFGISVLIYSERPNASGIGSAEFSAFLPSGSHFLEHSDQPSSTTPALGLINRGHPVNWSSLVLPLKFFSTAQFSTPH